MNIFKATADFERWLAKRLPIVRQDIALKHQHMADAAFPFFRATFYRWLQLWPEVCPELAKAPPVLAVGDLHLENFGTWRDEEGRLVWGVNDVDEACDIPYTLDLVRLATSAVLAIREGHLNITPPSACRAILDGYSASMKSRGFPSVLDGHDFLRSIVLNRPRDPARYWATLLSLPRAAGKVPRKKLRAQMPHPKAPCTFVH